MSEQLYRIESSVDVGQHEANDQNVAWLISIGVVVPVEAYEKREVCICLMSEGFDPQPPQRIHNNWCTYVEEVNDE